MIEWILPWKRTKKKNRGYTPRTEISNVKPFWYDELASTRCFNITDEREMSHIPLKAQKEFYLAKIDLWIDKLEGEKQ